MKQWCLSGTPARKRNAALKELARKVEKQKEEDSEISWDLRAPVEVTVPEAGDKALDSLTKGMAALTLDVQVKEHLESVKATVNRLEADMQAIKSRSLSRSDGMGGQEYEWSNLLQPERYTKHTSDKQRRHCHRTEPSAHTSLDPWRREIRAIPICQGVKTCTYSGRAGRLEFDGL